MIGKLFALALALATPVLAQTVPGPNSVPVARAIQLFDAVCTSTAKRKFNGAKAAMRANGIDTPSPWGTPTIYSATEDLSFNLGKLGGRMQCSMVFGTTDSRRSFDRALTARFGPLQQVDGGSGTFDPQTGFLILTNPPMANGAHTIFHLVTISK
jgi:hypothetical protein